MDRRGAALQVSGVQQVPRGAAIPSSATDYTYTPTGLPAASQTSAQNTYVRRRRSRFPSATATSISMAQVSEQFPSGSANYNARTFTIPDPGGTPKTYYITIADPAGLGDTGTTTNLTATCQRPTRRRSSGQHVHRLYRGNARCRRFCSASAGRLAAAASLHRGLACRSLHQSSNSRRGQTRRLPSSRQEECRFLSLPTAHFRSITSPHTFRPA